MSTDPVRVLLIKMSSMGDVIHTLPALTDAAAAIPNIQFDWVVEKAFAQIPGWHPCVQQILPIEFRKWRKAPLKALQSKQPQSFYRALRKAQYDYVLDAQGLLKSALVTRFCHGQRFGLDKHSAREPLASHAYQHRYAIDRKQHAVTRTRKLFAKALGYECPTTMADYQINQTKLPTVDLPITDNYIVFLHGTTWPTKHWPEQHWRALIEQTAASGKQILLPFGNDQEHERAKRLADGQAHVHVLPKLGILEVATVIAKADAVVAVDTGLGHLAAALAVPTISLYGPTNPELTGTVGMNQHHLCANFECAPCLQKQCTYSQPAVVSPACFGTVTPERVNDLLNKILTQCVTNKGTHHANLST